MPGRQRAGPAGPSPSRGPPNLTASVWLSAPTPSLRRAPSGPAPSPAPRPSGPGPSGPSRNSGPTGASGAVARQRPNSWPRRPPPCWTLPGRAPRPRRRCRPAPSTVSTPGWTRCRPAAASATWPGTLATAVRGRGACPGVQAESPALVLLGQREPRGLVGGTARRRPRPGQGPRTWAPCEAGASRPPGRGGRAAASMALGGGVGRQGGAGGGGQEFLTPRPRLPRGSPSSSLEPAGPHGPPAGAPTPCGGPPGPLSILLRVEALGDEYANIRGPSARPTPLPAPPQ